MAKKRNNNVITDLVNLVGEEKSIFILGIHKNTLYKWTIPTTKADARKPSQTAQTLAALYLFLIESCGWSLQEVEDSVDTLNERLQTYV